MASYLIAKRIDKRLANEISRSHNSHWHGDLYRSSAAAATPSLRLATLTITPFIISIA